MSPPRWLVAAAVISTLAPSQIGTHAVLLFDCSSSVSLCSPMLRVTTGSAAGRPGSLFEREPLSASQRAVREFGSAQAPTVAARVATFAREIPLSPAWFQGSDALLEAERAVMQRGGPSPVWDAVHHAARILETTSGGRVMLLVSDGMSTGNARGFETTLDYVRHRGIVVHVAVPTHGVRRPASLQASVPGAAAERLKRLADATGGRYAEAWVSQPQLEELSRFFRDIARSHR